MSTTRATVPVDPPCVTALVNAHYELAGRVARRVFGRRDRQGWLAEAESVAAMSLLRAARRYRPEYGPFVPWAVREIGEKLRRLLRRLVRQRESEPRVKTLTDEPEGREVRPRDYLESNRLRYVVRAAPMTSDQREAVRLRFLRGLTFDQIAAARGVTRSAAHSLVARGIANIRGKMLVDRFRGRAG